MKRLKSAQNISSVLMIDTGILGEYGKELLSKSGIKKLRSIWPNERDPISARFWDNLTSPEEHQGQIHDFLETSDLVILAAHVRQHDFGLTINDAILNLNLPFIFIRLEETVASMHTVIPYETPCIACLEAVRLLNQPVYRKQIQLQERISRKMWKDLEPRPEVKACLSSLLTLEFNRFLNERVSAVTLRNELEIFLETSQTVLHNVYKIPRCSACSLISKSSLEKKQADINESWRFDEKKGVFVTR